MKKLIVLVLLVLLVGAVPVAADAPGCGETETVILENVSDAPVTYTFTRGTHSGFVIVLPGQTVTTDLVCYGR